MNNNNKTIVNRAGPGFLSWLAILFIALKLTGIISWSWLWVLAPLWLGMIFWTVLLIVLTLLALIAS